MDIVENNYADNLGAHYTKEKTRFTLWAPDASNVRLALFGTNKMDYRNSPEKIEAMKKEENGLWTVSIEEDLNGEFYNFLVTNNESEKEVVDPYAKAVGVNGNRGMVVDLKETSPEGFENEVKPEFENPADAVIYELHVRDFSIDESFEADSEIKGKFNAFCEEGTVLKKSQMKTGIDYLKDLGITHIHFLPLTDYETVDEASPEKKEYNWGYDPKNYFVPEGSYSTDPFDGRTRIIEMKKMIQFLHKSGIRVIMDVVFNHTYRSSDSNLNLAVPGYYYRKDMYGNFSNGSGCGNELASERPMVRKLIVDAVCYWAQEYHVDGFRFDLMGLIDIKTMKIIRERLDKIDPSILIYGEGWTGGGTPLSYDDASIKQNIIKFNKMQIAAFSDDTRDGVKGNVFEINERGYVNGRDNMEDTIKFCVVGATGQLGINYDNIIYSHWSWANEPYQCINYISSHDNYTLWDKFSMANKNESIQKRIYMNKLAAAIVLTSQGIPFFQAGEEFLRSKKNEDGTFNHDSYNAPDSVNSLKWNEAYLHKDVVDYYKGLIALRRKYKAFRMNTREEIRKNLTFFVKGESFYKKNIVAYKIEDNSGHNLCNTIVVIFNGNDEEAFIDLKDCGWSVLVNKEKAGIEEIYEISGNSITVAGKSAHVLIKK